MCVCVCVCARARSGWCCNHCRGWHSYRDVKDNALYGNKVCDLLNCTYVAISHAKPFVQLVTSAV